MVNVGGIVMDGCDIGIMVLFNVEVKIFLVVLVVEWVKCWYVENVKKGIDMFLV